MTIGAEYLKLYNECYEAHNCSEKILPCPLTSEMLPDNGDCERCISEFRCKIRVCKECEKRGIDNVS